MLAPSPHKSEYCGPKILTQYMCRTKTLYAGEKLDGQAIMCVLHFAKAPRQKTGLTIETMSIVNFASKIIGYDTKSVKDGSVSRDD